MGKYKSKTTVTTVSVDDFIAALENGTRQADAKALVRIFKEVTGWKPRMWGPTIIGFGAYHYEYDSGHSGSICAVGFSPRKTNIAFYLSDFPDKEELLERLGKHKGGVEQCLYVNKLADVQIDILKTIIKRSVAELSKTRSVAAS